MNEAARPFAKEDINFRVGQSRGQYYTVLSYLDARMVSERLTELDPNWMSVHGDLTIESIPPRVNRDGEEIPRWHVAVECTLYTNGSHRSDVGEAIGDTVDEKIIKTVYSDALKRAAVHYGIGAYLYDLDMGVIPKDDVEYGRINEKALIKLRNKYDQLVFANATEKEKAAEVAVKKLTKKQVETLAAIGELAGKAKEKSVPWLKEQSRDQYDYLIKRAIGGYCSTTDTDDELRERMLADPGKAAVAILDGGIEAIKLVFGGDSE